MRKAFFQLHIAVFLAGFTGILGRLITLNEGLIVWYRLLITSATMWILFSLLKKIKRIPFREILKITGVGFIAFKLVITFGLHFTNAEIINCFFFNFLLCFFFSFIG